MTNLEIAVEALKEIRWIDGVRTEKYTETLIAATHTEPSSAIKAHEALAEIERRTALGIEG